MTKQLYYTDPYIKNFSATVLSCEKADGGWRVLLDRSAFYPGGGGQEADSGSLGGARTVSVFAEDGEIVHITNAPVSGEISCEIDFEKRLSLMQSHTGEHILSGLFHRLYGASNVGFHMGSEDVTLDLDIDPGEEAIRRVEILANEAIRKNLPVKAYFPAEDELSRMDFRSKLEFPPESSVRIVEIEGYDMCACSALHVSATGEIGAVKITSFARYKGGVRIHMLAGADAFWEFLRVHDTVTGAARRLSVKPEELSDAILRMESRITEAEREKVALCRALADSMIESEKSRTSPDGCALFFQPLFTAEELRYLVNRAVEHFSAAAAFSGSDSEGYLFVISAGSGDSRELLSRLKEKLPLSGGGKAEMVTGRVRAGEGEIRLAVGEDRETVF